MVVCSLKNVQFTSEQVGSLMRYKQRQSLSQNLKFSRPNIRFWLHLNICVPWKLTQPYLIEEYHCQQLRQAQFSVTYNACVWQYHQEQFIHV